MNNEKYRPIRSSQKEKRENEKRDTTHHDETKMESCIWKKHTDEKIQGIKRFQIFVNELFNLDGHI